MGGYKILRPRLSKHCQGYIPGGVDVYGRGRSSREWLNDLEDWRGKDLHSLSLEAQDRVRWRNMIGIALNTYGHCAHGL